MTKNIWVRKIWVLSILPFRTQIFSNPNIEFDENPDFSNPNIEFN